MAKRRKPSKPVTVAGPGCEERMELGTRDVHDPYQPGRGERCIVNVREHPLSFMVSRKLIDKAQEMAGEEFRRLYEASVIGGARGIDYGRPRVDGGKIGEPLSEQAMMATQTLNEVAPKLGPRGYKLLQDVIGEGQPLKQVAERWKGIIKGSDKDRALYIGERVRESLSDLARAWGFYGREGKIRAEIIEAPSMFLPEGQEWTPVERQAHAA